MNSNELKAEIVRKGYTTKSLAEKMNVSYSNLAAKIRGSQRMYLADAFEIAYFLNMDATTIARVFFGRVM